jgi:nitroreductase
VRVPERDKVKDDGTLNLRGATTPLMSLMLRRRSHRRHAIGRAAPEQVAHVIGAALAFMRSASFDKPRVVVVEGEEFSAVIAAATGGLVGKINPWLPFTNARHMLLCGAVYPADEDRRGVERAIAEAAMTMEVAILAATEVGLATCWMAGISHDRVELAYPMPDGARVVAISPLGLPSGSMGLSWDAAAFHLVSKHRKPIESMWMEETWTDGA